MSNPTARAWLALAAAWLLAWGGPSPAHAQATGSVEGVVTLRIPPPRRSADRYPGGAAQVHAVQEVPAVVFLQGPVPGSPPRPPARVPEMAQSDTAFAPAAMIVSVGARVRFPNADPFFHNVFSYSSTARFDLGRYPRGEAKEVTFDKPGIVKVYCEVHEFMRAVIVVTESPFAAVVDGDGRFRIDGIPEGTWTFTVWHPDLDPVERPVRIAAGGTARLDAELR